MGHSTFFFHLLARSALEGSFKFIHTSTLEMNMNLNMNNKFIIILIQVNFRYATLCLLVCISAQLICLFPLLILHEVMDAVHLKHIARIPLLALNYS